MNKLLLITLVLLLTASAALADHIGIYSDATGTGLCLGSPGFHTNATIIHKFTLGSAYSRFKLTMPAGSTFFSFMSPFPTVGSLMSDLSVAYGQCMSGSIVLGTVIAIYGSGQYSILAADPFPSILVADCNFGEHAATGGNGYVGPGFDECPVATEHSTWGKVKALYR